MVGLIMGAKINKLQGIITAISTIMTEDNILVLFLRQALQKR